MAESPVRAMRLPACRGELSYGMRRREQAGFYPGARTAPGSNPALERSHDAKTRKEENMNQANPCGQTTAYRIIAINRMEDGNPAGGFAHGVGFTIAWQDRGSTEAGRNGAFIEEVLHACLQRLVFFEDTQFASPHNADAIDHLASALRSLQVRREEREGRGVYGRSVP